jgi:ABC-type transport system substrate-binding protein
MHSHCPKGIRYSNGYEVRPADIRWGLLRALRGTAASYYSSVLGAKECIASASRCDGIAHGLVIDERSWRVTFRLTDPDPEFLYKLSSFVYATPPTVPIGESPDPIPGTGPYMVTGYKKGVKKLTLVRNPYFQQWSFEARPNGFPDEIHFTKVVAFRTRLDDVFSGRNDLINFGYNELPPDVARDLVHRYPRQLHSDFGLGHFYVWLDTRAPPFNDLRVRRALNYAVDRRRLVAMLGGSVVKSPACQFDPPNFPGYRPYCPYTRAAGTDGHYSGPDLTAARRLVAASKTAGMSLVVSSRRDDDPNAVVVAQYYVALLNKLGYHAKRDRVGKGYDGDPFAQLGIGYWGTDFPAPSNFWAPLLSCSSVRPRGAPTLNSGGYCNPAIDRLAKRALGLEVTDPTTARQLWTEVDHKLTDDAALAFGVAIRQAALVSADVGNYQANPVLGPLIDQMWVR